MILNLGENKFEIYILQVTFLIIEFQILLVGI